MRTLINAKICIWLFGEPGYQELLALLEVALPPKLCEQLGIDEEDCWVLAAEMENMQPLAKDDPLLITVDLNDEPTNLTALGPGDLAKQISNIVADILVEQGFRNVDYWLAVNQRQLIIEDSTKLAHFAKQ